MPVMILRMLLLSTSLLLLSGMATVSAQTNEEDATEHQIFYEKPVKDVKDAIYEESGEQINYEFKKQDNKLILKDYDGESKVKVTYVNQDGKTVEKTHYSCYIHPKPPS